MLLAPVRVPVPELDEASGPRSTICAMPARSGTTSGPEVDLDGYAASGLPATTMGRPCRGRLFFAAALAAGGALGALARQMPGMNDGSEGAARARSSSGSAGS